jgi:hypothetical protein
MKEQETQKLELPKGSQVFSPDAQVFQAHNTRSSTMAMIILLYHQF